jgi:hypothetical protein
MINFFKKSKKEPENLEEILAGFRELKESFEKIFGELSELKKKNKLAIQKLGIVRFNPFKEVGSDQSFSVAFLDDNDNGVVITSHYSREGNRVYGKPIKSGESGYSLSKEEIDAIGMAKNPETAAFLNGKGINGKKNSKKDNGKQQSKN